jgi:2'-5' RNA ligase
MRVFVAVELAAASRQAVGTFISSLRGHAAFSSTSIKWVAPSNLHITLRFIGEVPTTELGQVGAVVESPFRQPAFHATLETCGLFPPRGAPRVLWLGAREGAAQLCALHDEATRRLEACGVAAPMRPFHPHATIGRMKRAGRADAGLIRTVLDTIPVDVPRWLVGRVVLYESRLSAAGASYHLLTSGALGPLPG